MTDVWLKRWNERYRQPEFAYGIEPNEFLKEQIDKLKVGKILFGAEGEGRNGIYAAKNGWNVNAFDISEEGKNKALKLAKENNVSVNYKVGQLPELDFENDQFDVIALICAHFPSNIKSEYHKILNKKLKRDGILIFEAFGKNHLKYRNAKPNVGGKKWSRV